MPLQLNTIYCIQQSLLKFIPSPHHSIQRHTERHDPRRWEIPAEGSRQSSVSITPGTRSSEQQERGSTMCISNEVSNCFHLFQSASRDNHGLLPPTRLFVPSAFKSSREPVDVSTGVCTTLERPVNANLSTVMQSVCYLLPGRRREGYKASVNRLTG